MKLSDIREVAVSQKRALDSRELGLPRTMLPELPDIKSHALIVSGIRRCGKSTLLHQFVKKLDRDFCYFNLDDIRLYDFTWGLRGSSRRPRCWNTFPTLNRHT